MTSGIARGMSKYRISRLGRKLQISDDPRVLLALPKDVPERTWAELLQKEENELVCLDLREEILDAALKIGYEHYMEKQNTFFQVHCTAVALLKIIDWHFFRHDPGEDPSAYPPCFIPKRTESWTPDELPDPAVKDSWGRRELKVLEPAPEEILPSTRFSAVSVEVPRLVPIPEEYWFPGRVNLTTAYIARDGNLRRHVMNEEYDPGYPPPGWGCFDRVSLLCSDEDYDDSDHTIDRFLHYSSEVLQKITNYSSKDETPASSCKDPNRRRPNVELIGENCQWSFYECEPSTSSVSSASKLEATDSEILQKVTDYPAEEASYTPPESKHSSLKQTTPVDGSLQGAGDSTMLDRAVGGTARSRIKSKIGFMRSSIHRSRLPPLVAASLSKVTIISDCRLRNLRMDAQFEVSTEKIDSLNGQSGRTVRKRP